MRAGIGEVQYLVIPNASNPHLLARVRWPDVFQAISPVRTDWQSDPGLFDLPYEPTSTTISFERAAAIAAEWGAQLPAEAAFETPPPSMVRRMPATWSNLSRAEKRSWSIQFLDGGSRRERRQRRRDERSLVILEDAFIDLTDTSADGPATVEDA